MNENIDLTKILKDCPKGWKFYSDVYGEVTFWGFSDLVYPIQLNTKNHGAQLLSEKGEEIIGDGKCILFPSEDERLWSKFTAPWYKKKRFDPNTLQPFDKVIARIDEHGIWCCEWFSFIDSFIEENITLIKGCGAYYRNCVPYNDDTKHLVGTTDEAPEYYRYWED